ncbi:MAG: hypothetical protein JW395_0279 [Nitrospira sp.]|nr:hypothetical protein [Nitrospira sp.]
MQIYCGNLLDDFKESVSLLHFFDLFFKFELLNDLARTGGEPGDVVAEVGGELVRITKKCLEGELACVVEGQLELLVDDFLDGLGVILLSALSFLCKAIT